MKMLKNILLLVVFVVVASCTRYYTMSESTDWDRAVRVEKDISSMFDKMPMKIKEPITMYEAMAFAIKNNYEHRIALYRVAINDYVDGLDYDDTIMKVNKAGYANTRFSDKFIVDRIDDTASGKARSTFEEDNKTVIAWNSLDFGLSYYQSRIHNNRSYIDQESRRKVIHNLLQDVRASFWKALIAQRLLPVIDELNEEMSLFVDGEKTDIKLSKVEAGKEQLERQQNLMRSIKNLTSLKRELENSKTELITLMGLHPVTEFKLVGAEEGNFDIPQIRNKLSRIEWLSLMSRPEIRQKDYQKDIQLDALKQRAITFVSNKELSSINTYAQNPSLYKQRWIDSASKQLANLFGASTISKEKSVIEEKANLEELERQNLSLAILSQVHLAWSYYQSAVEDYQIDKEITDLSEKLAQIHADENAPKYDNLIKSADAVYDEVSASISYAKLQEALGRLYVTIGLDAMPKDIYLESVRTISKQLESIMVNWDEGYFTLDDAPLKIAVPPKRPAVMLTAKLPDLKIAENERVHYSVDFDVFEEAELSDNVVYTAGLEDDKPLPQWLYFDDETLTFTGTPNHGFTKGEHIIKIYARDEFDSVAWASFKLIIEESFVPSIYVRGLYDDSKAIVMKKCKGSKCEEDRGDALSRSNKDDYVPLISQDNVAPIAK